VTDDYEHILRWNDTQGRTDHVFQQRLAADFM